MSKAYEFLKGKSIAVHCETEEEAKEFFEMIKDDGIKWNSGVELNIDNHRNGYEENTCYRIDINERMLYGDSRQVRKHNDKIIEFTELKKKVEKEKLKVGDRVEVTKLHADDHIKGVCVGGTGTVVYVYDIGCRVKFDKQDGTCPMAYDQLRKVEENKMEFSKKDLKSGMVVELRNGSKRLIIECDEGLICVEISNADFVSQYNKDLTHSVHKHLDIQKVFDYPTISINYMIGKNKKPIWERKAPKEMTIKEIEKELGYPIKIVKE